MNLAMPVKMPQNGYVAVPYNPQGQQQFYYNTPTQGNFPMNPMSKEFHLNSGAEKFEPKKPSSLENSTQLSKSSQNSGSISMQNVEPQIPNNIENIPPQEKPVE